SATSAPNASTPPPEDSPPAKRSAKSSKRSKPNGNNNSDPKTSRNYATSSRSYTRSPQPSQTHVVTPISIQQPDPHQFLPVDAALAHSSLPGKLAGDIADPPRSSRSVFERGPP